MKKNARIVSFSLLAACLFLPGVASSEKPGKGNRGGKAMDHRSEQGEERSNAQWQDDATRGRERADEGPNRNGDIDESEKPRGKGDKKSDKKNTKKHADGEEGNEDAKSEESRNERRDLREKAPDPKDESSESAADREERRDRREGDRDGD
jgi:hypothetical protein